MIDQNTPLNSLYLLNTLDEELDKLMDFLRD